MGLRTPPADVEGAQLVFAKWLDAGTRVGLVLLVLGFAAYVSGLMPAHYPIEDLPRLWGLPLHEFRAATGGPRGWEWLGLIGYGDYLNYVGIGVLASIVVVAYIRIFPLLLEGERVFAVIAAAEILVLVIAASGLLSHIPALH